MKYYYKTHGYGFGDTDGVIHMDFLKSGTNLNSTINNY